MGGKLTLCKSVLGSLGLYWFSLFKAPKKILSEMENIRRRFFWEFSEDKCKFPWVAWDKICASREKGGLGVRSFHAQNLALITKWWWRYKKEPDSLWRRTIEAFHDLSGGLTEDTNSRLTAGIWGRVAKISATISKFNMDLNCLFSRSIGNGSKTKF